MESIGRTNDFINNVFYIFTPPMIKLTISYGVENKILETHCFNTSSQVGRKRLLEFLYEAKYQDAKVIEIRITTTAGTIRESSSSHDERPHRTVKFMGMHIDILPCSTEVSELQQVCLTENCLHVYGVRLFNTTSNIWKEILNGNNTRSYRMPMPVSVPNVICTTS